jgi:hypothetical protein
MGLPLKRDILLARKGYPFDLKRISLCPEKDIPLTQKGYPFDPKRISLSRERPIASRKNS